MSLQERLHRELEAAHIPVPMARTSYEPYNMRLARTAVPLAVAGPRTHAHVASAVRIARELGVKVSARGGGHSYSASGLGGERGHLVLDMDEFRSIAVKDDDDRTAAVGAGARLGEVAEMLAAAGRGIPHGTCPGVGIAGHVLHGGFGLHSHTKGLTLDYLVGATVVLADASTAHCSAAENSDLFFAMRGAGSSFGIALEFEFRTFALPASVCILAIRFDWHSTDQATHDQAVVGFATAQDISSAMPREANFQISLRQDGAWGQGMFWGGEAEARKLMGRFESEAGGRDATVDACSWIEYVKKFAWTTSLVQRLPYQARDTFYATSLATPPLSAAQIGSLVGYWRSVDAPRSWFVIFDVHGGQHSAIRDARGLSAYAHRDRLWLVQFYDGADDCGLMQRFSRSITAVAVEGWSWGMYANYPDTELEGDEARRRYYGHHLGRLRQIKKAYDVDDVFCDPQSIRPA